MAEISIIAPTIKEERAPEIAKEIFKVFGKGIELIIVDKSDTHYRKLFRGTGATVRIQKSKGYEYAIMEGFSIAKGTKVLASLDPDGTYAVRDLKRVVDAVKSGKADFASGDRSGCSFEAMGPYLKLGNFLFAVGFDVLFLQRMKDVFSGSFAMSREAFESIRNVRPYYSGTLFFEMELAKRGFRLRNVPVLYAPRIGTVSKLAKSKTVYASRVLASILRDRWREASYLLSELFEGRFRKD
ncbi:MAG: glycosyltransferase [Candidatus Marsarchaeota archaeon]|jgi:glycosyltransferase involved in cell wall biosynthesis|nr:glycosyltransferase [Candidatus Marsarchaeota archaeon]MCL5111919.1 glycosyltransferase [Candidatus Marsarchaeota archaeon]